MRLPWNSPPPMEPEPGPRDFMLPGSGPAGGELPDRRPLVTGILILLNLAFAAAVTLDERVRGNPFSLIDFGAKHRLLIESGQHWRLLTAAFLHQGLLHLAVNMYALWMLGRFCEPIYGHGRFLLIYLGAALGGSLASMRFTDEPSVGASGALFGLLGAALVFGFMHRKELPEAIGRRLRASLVFWLLVNLALGFVFPFLDHWGHIGGLAAGMSLAVLLGNDLFAPRGAPLAVRVATWTAGGLAVVCLGLGVWNRLTVSYATLAEWVQAAQETAEGDVEPALLRLRGAIEKARGREPWLVMVHLDRARALALNGDEGDAVSAALADAAGEPLLHARYPWSLEAAERFASLDRYADAEALYRRALKQRAVASASNNLAWMYLTARDPGFYRPRAALPLAEAAVKADGENPFYLGTLGAAQLRNSRYRPAIENLTKAVNLHDAGEEGTDLYLLVVALSGMGRREEARAVLEHAIEHYPDDRFRSEAEAAIRRRSLGV
jgi:rhomboid protease GluP